MCRQYCLWFHIDRLYQVKADSDCRWTYTNLTKWLNEESQHWMTSLTRTMPDIQLRDPLDLYFFLALLPILENKPCESSLRIVFVDVIDCRISYRRTSECIEIGCSVAVRSERGAFTAALIRPRGWISNFCHPNSKANAKKVWFLFNYFPNQFLYASEVRYLIIELHMKDTECL